MDSHCPYELIGETRPSRLLVGLQEAPLSAELDRRVPELAAAELRHGGFDDARALLDALTGFPG